MTVYRPEVKICGLTCCDDAIMAMEYGADWLGFVLYDRSPRAVTPSRLARIAARIAGRARLVGVFVNMPACDVARIAGDCGLAAAQLHGDECRDDYGALKVPVWRALRIAGRVPRPAPDTWPAGRYVADAAVPGAYGGTGVLADWDTAARLARKWPLMLAGGLTPANVAAAVRRVRPLGVDVAGGVERAPGRKKAAAIRAFIEAARPGGA